jgi:hypothetical protein
MLKEDRPGSFPLTIRFKRGEDSYYDDLRGAPNPRQFIKSRLLGTATPIVDQRWKDPQERIADSLEQIVDLLKNVHISLSHSSTESIAVNDHGEERGRETELSKRFSEILGSALQSRDWSGR